MPSTTNSSPWRNSWTRTPSLTRPRPLVLPTSVCTASRTSATDRHAVTPSLPADSKGLTIMGTAKCKSGESTSTSGAHSSRSHCSTGGHSHARSCRTARTPAARTFSPMSHLFRRASAPPAPLLRTSGAQPSLAMCAESKSANFTPVSAPATTATSSRPATAFWSCAASAAAASGSGMVSSVTPSTASQGSWPRRCAGTIAASASEGSSERTCMMANPARAASAATQAPVENASTTTKT
mmetsp:Transcript_20258/g.68628  ORF Transcript_20258/g.68628 Transcript_20258/m.68628 type:complete len:239 (+) Transcript_20258:705-1421(+)